MPVAGSEEPYHPATRERTSAQDDDQRHAISPSVDRGLVSLPHGPVEQSRASLAQRPLWKAEELKEAQLREGGVEVALRWLLGAGPAVGRMHLGIVRDAGEQVFVERALGRGGDRPVALVWAFSG